MTWHTLFDPALCGRLCLTLLHSFWQVALLAIAARLISRRFRGRLVELDYVVHLTALVVAILLLPITFCVIGPSPTHTTESVASIEQRQIQSDQIEPLTSAVAVSNGSPRQLSTSAQTDDRWSIWLTISPWLAASYIAGVCLMMIRLGSAVMHAERLRIRAQPVTAGPLADSLRAFREQWSLRVTPVLAVTESIALPKVIGLFRPMILFPASALSGLTASELETILAHELAHVRRYDLWTNLLQRLAEVVLFFNPLAWYLSRRIGALREHCCDEMACRMISSVYDQPRLQYVTALLRMVEHCAPEAARYGEIAALAASGRSPSELRRRVARILGDPLNDSIQFSRGGVVLLVATILFAFFGSLMTRTEAQTVTPKPEASPAKKEPAKIETQPAMSKTFSFGSKIEVLALGTHDEMSQPQKWWDVEGRPLDKVPFTWKSEDEANAGDILYRKIVFRIHDIPERAHVAWSVPSCYTSAGGKILIDGKPAPGYFTQYFGVPKSRESVGLKIGIAAGPWKTVVKASGQSAHGMNDLSVVFSEPMQTGSRTTIIVSHNCFDRDFRVIAHGKDGETRHQIGRGGSSAGQVYQSKAAFLDISPAEIDYFEFQVRDYEWIEFENLPLQAVNSVRQK